MKTVLKVLGFAALGIVVLVGGAVVFLSLKPPARRAASTETIAKTPERLARGKYLVEHVTDCLTCHSDVHGDRFGSPVKAGTAGKGGFPFTKDFEVPGVVCAQNITSDPETGLGAWTDGEILRAFREGIDRQGNALFPMMPYEYYRSLSDEDAKAIVTYLRTLPPLKNKVPAKSIDFPVNLFIKMVPKPLDGPVTSPDDEKDHLGYGRYLVTITGCPECHTAHDDKGKLVPGRDFAGGWVMKGPWGRVVTANITPHPDTFMGKATKAEFIGRFKAFESLQGENAPIADKGRNTIMPWLPFAEMTEKDLGAIYDYLKTLKPIENKVECFPDAPAVPAAAPSAAGAAKS